jgi:hypothetical protein
MFQKSTIFQKKSGISLLLRRPHVTDKHRVFL